MVKRNPIQSVYWLENPKSKIMPWEKCMIAESRNLLRTILSLKHQEMTKKRELKKQSEHQNEKYQIKKQSKQIQRSLFSEQNPRQTEQFRPKETKSLSKSKQSMSKEMKDQNQNSQDQLTEQSKLFTKLLEKFLERAQRNKKKLKMVKGLTLEQEFVPDSIHVCQYCGRKFLKPCSLGGHISKLHWEERKREKEMFEMPDWEFETPVRRS